MDRPSSISGWHRSTAVGTQFGPDAGVDYWRQWYLLWDAEPGRHTLTVRAQAADGEYQTEERATPFPDGSSGLQQIVVRVT